MNISQIIMAAGVLLILSLGGVAYWQIRENGKMAVELAAEKEINKKNTDEIEKIKTDSKAAMESVTKSVEAERERITKARQRERKILNAPESENGAVAPVLRDSLKRLQHIP